MEVDDFDRIERLLREALARIQAARAERLAEDGRAPLKRSDGRLTDAGRMKLVALAQAGVTDAQVARELNITPSAAGRQRKKLLGS